MGVGELKHLPPILWLFIFAMCVLDVYLTGKYQHSLPQMEENPIGRWLLKMDNGSPALLLSAKWASNSLMMLGMILVHWARPKWSLPVASVMAVVQILFLFWVFR